MGSLRGEGEWGGVTPQYQHLVLRKVPIFVIQNDCSERGTQYLGYIHLGCFSIL